MNKAFTLIEVMVVIVIIAIMSSVVMLNINSTTYGTFMSYSQKIATTLELLSDQAIYNHSVIICQILPTGLDCMNFKDNGWEQLKLNNIIAGGWPSTISIKSFNIDGINANFGDKIRFLISGDNQTLSLQVSNGNYDTWIDSDLLGNYKVEN